MNNALPKTGIDASRVAPKLWIGGFNPDSMVVHRAGFTSLIRVAGELFPHDFPLTDARLTPALEDLVEQAVARVLANISRGHRTLVTCAMGLNRSALVAGLAMVRFYRMPPEQAIGTIRQERHPAALSNASFVEYLNRNTQPR